MKIKTVIADDEKHARDRLKSLLCEFEEITVVGEAADGDELINLIMKYRPDAVFADINMPGISVFKSLEQLIDAPAIVFQTAYSEFALKAFDVNAVDYLLKPVTKENLIRAVQRIGVFLSKDRAGENKYGINDFIAVKVNDGIRIINHEDIIKISFTEGFAFVYTSGSRFITDKFLNHYEKLLKEKGFIRVSRENIVNIKKIAKIHKTMNSCFELEMINNDFIKISRRKINDLKDRLSF